MIIHKSHSKTDIIKIFSGLCVVIDKKLTKGEIIDNFDIYIDRCVFNETIGNLTALIDYLTKISPKIKISVEDKKHIMMKCKRLIKYGTLHYVLNSATYRSHGDAFNDCMAVYKYGDIPSVRRACKLYNQSPHKKEHVNAVISDIILEELRERDAIKQIFDSKLAVKRGVYHLEFN